MQHILIAQQEIAAAYQPLFNILHEHGLIPLESEMDEIIRASLQVVANINQQASIARLKEEMTKEEITASEKAKWEQLKTTLTQITK